MKHILTILIVLVAGSAFGQTRLNLKQLDKADDASSVIATGSDSLAKYVGFGYGFYFDGDSLAVDTSLMPGSGSSGPVSWDNILDIPALLDLDSTDNVEWGDTSSVIVTLTRLTDSLANVTTVESDPVWISDSSTYAAKVLVFDTAAAIRADFPDISTLIDGAELADTAAAIRADFPSGSGSTNWNDLINIPADIADGDDDTQLSESEVEAFIDGDETAFSGWDKDASDDFSGAWGDLTGVPANLDTDATDDFDGAFSSLSGIPTGLSDGDDDTQLNESQVEAFIDGDETSFDGWDKDASDDFSGAYGDLTGVPADIDTDATDDINWSDTTALISTLTNLADSTAAVRADFPDISTLIDGTELADTAAAIRADFPAGGGSDGVLDSVLFRNDTLLYVTSNDDTIRFSLDTLTRVAGYGLVDNGDTLKVDTTVISGGSGGGGLSQVTSDGTLSGLGTGGDPLEVDTTVIAPKDWVNTRGFITSESDPVWVSDSADYAAKSLLADSTAAVRADFPDISTLIDGTELADTASVIRGDFPDVSGFITSESDPVWISDSSTYAAKALVADSTAAVRADFPDVSSFIDTEADPVWISDSANYTLKTVLADTAAAIRADFPTPGSSDGVATAGSLDTGNEEIDITVASPGSNFSIDISGIENLSSFSGWDTDASNDFSGSYNDLSDTPANIDEDSTNDIEWTDTTTLIATLTNLADTASAIRADFPSGSGSTNWNDLTNVPAGFDDDTDDVDDADADAANEGILGVSASGDDATVTSNTTGANGVTFQDGAGLDILAITGSNGGDIRFFLDFNEFPTSNLLGSNDELIWLDGGLERKCTFANMVGDLTLIARSELADTSAAIRADFPTGGGDVSFSDTTSTIATKTDIEELIYFDSTQVGSSFSIDFENADRGVQMLDLNAQATATLSSVSNVPAGALFTLWITNANGSGTTLTLPSSFVQADGTAITSNEVTVNSGDRITILYNDTSSLYYTTIME